MDTIRQSLLAGLEVPSWVEGLFVLPFLAVLLIFGLRELVLWAVARFAGDRMHRQAWKRGTRFVAILLSLVVVALILKAYAADIATALFSGAEGRIESLILDVVRFAGSTAVFVVLLIGLGRGFRATISALETWRQRSSGIRFQGAILLSPDQVTSAAELAVRVLRFALVVLLLLLYIPLVLSSIPATAHLADRVIPLVKRPVAAAGRAVLGYLPNLIMLVLLAVVFRWILRVLRIFRDAVKAGNVKLGGFDPAWADQTYRLLHMLLFFFAIVVMYPLLPGSQSAVFKGVSVFAGAVATFGLRSTVANLMSGLVLTYNGTFKTGDRVRIGGTTGDVQELGAFVTQIRSLNNESVVIPNAVIMGGEIVNLSRASTLGGLKLRIQVGIGYDTPWQQVYELLVGAAKKTANVKSDPAPNVLQSSLDDYAVTYTLVVTQEDPKKLPATRTELAENIQDAFNEAGLEIMTPAVRAIRNSLDPAIPPKYDSTSGGATRFRIDFDSEGA